MDRPEVRDHWREVAASLVSLNGASGSEIAGHVSKARTSLDALEYSVRQHAPDLARFEGRNLRGLLFGLVIADVLGPSVSDGTLTKVVLANAPEIAPPIGRPSRTTTSDRASFRAALHSAILAVRGRGVRVTQERVAEEMAPAMGSADWDTTTLQRYLRDMRISWKNEVSAVDGVR
jgi:hypothetical protein